MKVAIIGLEQVGKTSLFGALTQAYRGDFKRKGRYTLLTAFAAAACIVGFSSTATPALALPSLFGIGFSMVQFFATGNTLVQQLVTGIVQEKVTSIVQEQVTAIVEKQLSSVQHSSPNPSYADVARTPPGSRLSNLRTVSN